MQAAHHWDILAADVASRLKQHLTTASLSDQAINVVPNTTSAFEQGFEDLLITQMVEQGLDIRANNNERLKLTFHTQVVSHHDRDYISPEAPGKYTALALIATGVWAAVNVGASTDALIAAAVIGTGLALDINEGSAAANAGNISDVTNKEVIISISLMDGDKYLMRKTGIYYINEPDDDQYEVHSKSISVVSE